MARSCRFILFLIAVLLAPGVSSAATSQWYANAGGLPDASCPWTLFDDASPEAPTLSQGYKLTLATSDPDENMYYTQSSSLAIPSLLTISARLRLISESHFAGNPRRGVCIEFAVAPDQANFLWIGQDEVFLWSAYGTQGPTALVDTDNAFHTYDIQVANQSSVTVFQDGVQILTGSIIATGGSIPGTQIIWGDLTGNSSAVSEWVSFVHNANTSSCGAGPVPPALSVNDVMVTEGSSGTVNATFTVSLNHRTDQGVTLDFTTADNTATTADNDYVLASGPVAIPAEALSTTLTVLVNGDNAYEPSETFFVNLSNAVNATIADGQGRGTIRSDDLEVVGDLELAWEACPGNPGAVLSETFDCSGSTTYVLNARFRAPVPIADMTLMVWEMELASESATLPPFWQMDTGDCNDGGVSLEIQRPSSGCSATQPTWSFSDGRAMVYAGVGGNHALIQGYATSTSGIDLSAGTYYFGFKLTFSLAQAVEAGGSCPGCTTPVCIRWNDAIIRTQSGDQYRLLPGTLPYNLTAVNSPSIACNQIVAVEPIPEANGISSTAWPNPFRSEVTVEFGVPTGTLARMEVFDVHGRRVHRGVPVFLLAGRRRLVWDGRGDDGRAQSAGVYLVRVSGRGLDVVQRVTRAK